VVLLFPSPYRGVGYPVHYSRAFAFSAFLYPPHLQRPSQFACRCQLRMSGWGTADGTAGFISIATSVKQKFKRLSGRTCSTVKGGGQVPTPCTHRLLLKNGRLCFVVIVSRRARPSRASRTRALAAGRPSATL